MATIRKVNSIGSMKVCRACGMRYDANATRCPLDGGALDTLADPLIGRTIGGRYVIEEHIGSGGMGNVYRARYEVVGRNVALKFLAPRLASDENQRKRFLREARAANRINHEHIIDITDYGETDDGLVYLVMEYLKGKPLTESIRRGPLPIRRSLAIARQVMLALGRAHELGVIHRDIKPDNIFLIDGYDGDFIKLLDFGLAKMKDELSVTAQGVVFGTPEYMAPEQARGTPVSSASDLYAFGVMFFEMLTGRRLFTGEGTQVMLKHLRENPRPPSTENRVIPPAVDMLVLRLLDKDPQKRPASGHLVAEELRLRIEELGGRHAPELNPQITVGPSIPAPRTLAGDGTYMSSWRSRVEFYVDAVARVYGDRPPAWIAESLEEIRARVEGLAEVRESLERRIQDATRQESEARAARERIGRAVDALAADLASATESLAGAESELVSWRARHEEATRELPSAWGAIPRWSPELSHDLVALDALAAAGRMADGLLAASLRIEELERTAAAARTQRDDVRFQIEQLRGRLGGFNAMAELDLSGLKAQLAELDQRQRAELASLAEEIQPIVEHLEKSPASAALFVGGTGTLDGVSDMPPPGQTGSEPA